MEQLGNRMQFPFPSLVRLLFGMQRKNEFCIFQFPAFIFISFVLSLDISSFLCALFICRRDVPFIPFIVDGSCNTSWIVCNAPEM